SLHYVYRSHTALLQPLYFNDLPTPEIYTLSLHDALPILLEGGRRTHRPHDCHDAAQSLLSAHLYAVLVAVGAVADQRRGGREQQDRKSTRLNSSHLGISYAVFCLKKKKKKNNDDHK